MKVFMRLHMEQDKPFINSGPQVKLEIDYKMSDLKFTTLIKIQ